MHEAICLIITRYGLCSAIAVAFASFRLSTLNLMKIRMIHSICLVLVAFICQLQVQSAVLFFTLFIKSVKYACRKLVKVSNSIFKFAI
jgi:hypothetical protein